MKPAIVKHVTLPTVNYHSLAEYLTQRWPSYAASSMFLPLFTKHAGINFQFSYHTYQTHYHTRNCTQIILNLSQ